ncbi:MAG: ATP-binding cassette domain-containing protein [Bacteroidetes bacterium]|nr:MAG: ATP-binding cassette domain-containing protein [Bacteroidota bacterium]
MIEIIDLHKSFGLKTVLNGVNLTIPSGESKCIIGKSGCGKSVLIKHIVGLLAPDKGKVLVDGMEIESLSKEDLFKLRQNIGFVFQGSALFDSYNVFENIVVGLYEHGLRNFKDLEEEAVRVLSSVGLLPDKSENETNNFNKEWQILRNKKPSDLSGGMRKRVGVARALVGNPSYIIYDEPTTGLDPVTSEQIDKLIADLTKKMNVTSIIITHDMFSVLRIAHTVTMLDDGRVHFDGTPDEFYKSDDPINQEFLERYMKK